MNNEISKPYGCLTEYRKKDDCDTCKYAGLEGGVCQAMLIMDYGYEKALEDIKKEAENADMNLGVRVELLDIINRIKLKQLF